MINTHHSVYHQQGPKLLHSKPETPWQGGIKEISKINKILKKRLDAAKQKDTKEQQPVEKPVVVMKMPQIIDNGHCLAVAKALLQLILAMDHSSSADMMLLCFKVSILTLIVNLNHKCWGIYGVLCFHIQEFLKPCTK